MRPEAYIYDDGNQYELRPNQNADTTTKPQTNMLDEQQQQKANLRKVSLISEDSADMFGLEKNAAAGIIKAKPPYLNIHIRHETTSTESKDTLTPIEPSDMHAPDEDENGSTENIMELNFETARQKALRRRAMGRRSSETCSNYDLNRSQTSLNAILAMSRRQLSLTQSEPDSGNELLGWSSLYFRIIHI